MASIGVVYGEGEKRFEVEDKRLLRVVDYPRVGEPSAAEERAAVERALGEPIGSATVRELAKAGKRGVILVDDWTRPTPAYKILPVLLEQLVEAGCGEHLTIIMARGSHRELTRAEMEQKLGREVVARYEVTNHDKDGELVHLGESSRGTPVWINRTVAEADVRIAVGNVCAHPIAGYGGGAKIVVPGVAGRETIHLNHSLADDPKVTIGCADGNPVREDMEEMARMAGLDMIVNTILSPSKKIVDVVAGDVVAAHREGVRRYCARYGVEVKEEADVGVVGASPRDASFGHATFALYAALPMVRRGGTVILVAPCAEGPGTREDRVGFREKASLPPEELMKLIRSGEVDASGGAFDYVYSKALGNYRVALVSDNYSPAEAEEMGLAPAESLQQAVDEALAAAGREGTVSVMPVGGLTVPVGEG